MSFGEKKIICYDGLVGVDGVVVETMMVMAIIGRLSPVRRLTLELLNYLQERNEVGAYPWPESRCCCMGLCYRLSSAAIGFSNMLSS